LAAYSAAADAAELESVWRLIWFPEYLRATRHDDARVPNVFASVLVCLSSLLRAHRRRRRAPDCKFKQEIFA